MRTLALPSRTFGVPRRLSRLLFSWEARDGSLIARSGQVGSFSRTSIGTAIDSNGRLRQPVHSQPRWELLDANADGVREAHLLLEDTRTNLCLQPENFGTTWVATNTPTRVAAAHTSSGVSLDLIGDDSAGLREGYGQGITFTGNDVKAISVYVKAGTSTSSLIEVSDTTASAGRLLAVITWSGGLPVIAVSVGTSLGYETLAGGVFRILLATSAVIAANATAVFVWPATDVGGAVGNTGTIYAGGVQVENAPFPSSYVKTTTVSVTRAAEALAFPFLAVPQALTLYTRFVERGTIQQPGAGGVVLIGSAAGGSPSLYLDVNAGGKYEFVHQSVLKAAAAAPVRGDTVELRGQLNADGSVQLGQSINGGAEVVTTASAARAFDAAWSGTTLYVNNLGTGAYVGFNAFEAIRVAAGVRSMAYMRAAS